MTATVETVVEQLDLAPILSHDRVGSITATNMTRSVTLSDGEESKRSRRSENDPQQADPEENPEPLDDDVWQTSAGNFKFNLQELPQQLQFIHQILKDLPNINESNVLYFLLQSLHLFVLHGDALSKAMKDHKGFVVWCQENLIIRNLWELCNSEHSHICEVGVPILLHCVSLDYGSDVFWKIVQDDFHNTDWKIRFTAVERATVIARFMDSTPLKSDISLQAALANVFCHLISSMDDISPHVAQRATLYLGTIHDTALRSLVMCLETQFDTVIIDRPMVIQTLYQLHNALSDRKVITWDFFLNRFDTLFLEAQINADRSADISYLRDLLNLDFTNENFVKKINRIQEALSTQSSDSHLAKTLSASFGHKWPYKRTMSAPASIIPRQDLSKDSQSPRSTVGASILFPMFRVPPPTTDASNNNDKDKPYNRQYSAPILPKRKLSRFGLEGQQLPSLNITEETSFSNILNKVIEMEQSDKETIHLLVFLLMQFLSRAEQAYPSDEKNIAKKQTIVLRHLYLLLGYNQIERIFQVSPLKLRTSPVFNAFVSNLSQLFDQNSLMGVVMLPTSLLLLQYSPCPPHHVIPDFQAYPSYSLWYLEPVARRSWLMSLLVLLYKYHYNEESLAANAVALVKIVINTLDAQHHVCRRIPPTVVMGGPPSRSRDVSQPSLGTDERDLADNSDTPPPSPKQGSVLGSNLKASLESCWGDDHSILPFSRLKKPAFSPEGNGSDIELAVIPEKENQDSEDEDVPHDIAKKKSTGSIRPMWFPDACDKHTDVKPEAGCSNLFGKLGVREGVKMLVSSSLFSVASPTSPPLVKSPTTTNPQVLHKLQEKQSPKELTTPTVREKTTPDLSISSDIYPPWQISAIPKPTKNLVPPPTPSGERLTPTGMLKPGVGQGKSISPKTFHYDEPWGSPDSPLSRMDIHMLHSPMSSFDSYSQCEASPTQSVTQLELPVQERLLPIGISSSNTGTAEGMKNLVQHITEALGVHENVKKDELSCSRTPTDLDSMSISPSTVTKQNSLDKPDLPQRSRSTSPRRLTKQLALDSPPQDTVDGKKPDGLGKRQQKQQQNVFAMSHQDRKQNADSVDLDPSFQNACHSAPQLSRSTLRVGDECIFERCSECGTIREEYSDEEVALCLILVGTFVHREPELAAPMLPDIISLLSKYASQPSYTWQSESKVHLPGGAVSVAHQFLRCILHQMAPHGVFFQIFQTVVPENYRTQFFRSLVQSLLDFNDLNPIAPLQLLLENINTMKTLPTENLDTVIDNIACYMDFLPIEAGLGAGSISWASVLTQLEIFFRSLLTVINTFENVTPFFRIMISILRVPAIITCRGLLEPFSKILSFSIQFRQLKYSYLIDLCYLCNRGFNRDREKLMLTRVVVIELVQALKFKTSITLSNFFMLISFVLQDIGGVLPPAIAQDETLDISSVPYYTTGASECMKNHVQDVLDFLSEVNMTFKLKYFAGVNEDTAIGTLKSGIAQYVTLEFARNNSRDARAASKYLPWLYNVQKETREISECIVHIRLLSWLLIGGLTQSCLQNSSCIPIPQETACYVADHIHTILTSYMDHVNNGTPFPMNTLYHVFILCQLWTVYMEHASSFNLPSTEAHALTMSILFDFWGKVTNDILTLLNSSQEVVSTVNFYFINLLETLYHCNTSLLARLIPIWTPILFSHNLQLSISLTVKLQECRNFTPKAALSHQSINNNSILKWLKKLQFQLGQNECSQSQQDRDALLYEGEEEYSGEPEDGEEEEAE